MRISRLGIVVLALGLSAGAGLAQQPAAPARAAGYLAGVEVAQAAVVLPPAPVAGSERYENDRHIFALTRRLEGTPRWALAQADNVYTAPHLLEVFSCGIGAKMTPQNAPVTLRILSNMLVDQNKFSATAKDVFKRQRPYLIDEANICIPKTDGLAASPDYPSGHTTLGWTDPGGDRAGPGRGHPDARPRLRRKPRGLRRPQRQRHRGRAHHRRHGGGGHAQRTGLPGGPGERQDRGCHLARRSGECGRCDSLQGRTDFTPFS